MTTDSKIISKMFKRTEFGNIQEMKTQVVNPLSGEEYVHIGHVEQIDGKDDYQAWAGRGEAVKIHFWDENGGEFALCFGFHKGYTFSWVENCTTEGKLNFDDSEDETQ